MQRPAWLRRSKRDDQPPANAVDESLRPLPAWFIVLAVGTALLVSVPLTLWLLHIAGPDPTRQIDAIRTGLTTAAGTGGLFALWLAFHRQRSTERIAESNRLASKRDHDQRERQADQTDRDASSRRITDQYTKAAEQLGSDRAPVRLAGIYALERIGETNSDQRQKIVNLLCAYLRMPYMAPSERADNILPADFDETEEQTRAEELQVRLSAQTVLSRRLFVPTPKPDVDLDHWSKMSIDLSGATLIDFNLVDCHLTHLKLSRAELIGRAQLAGMRVLGEANFQGTAWQGGSNFNNTSFAATVKFDESRFAALSTFIGTRFHDAASFSGTEFEEVEFDAYAISQPETELFHVWPDECNVAHSDTVGSMIHVQARR